MPCMKDWFLIYIVRLYISCCNVSNLPKTGEPISSGAMQQSWHVQAWGQDIYPVPICSWPLSGQGPRGCTGLGNEQVRSFHSLAPCGDALQPDQIASNFAFILSCLQLLYREPLHVNFATSKTAFPRELSEIKLKTHFTSYRFHTCFKSSSSLRTPYKQLSQQ